MADAVDRRNDDLSYSPVPRPRRKKQEGSALAGLAAVSLLATAVVFVQFPAPAPTAVDDPPPAVMERLPPPEAAIAPAQETRAAAAPAEKAPAAPATVSPREFVYTQYTTDPGVLSRAVVRIDGKVVLNRQLFRGKKDGGAAVRAMPTTNCTHFFRVLAGGKPIYTDAVTAALPAARRYSLEVRWYDADGDEFSRDVFDVDGKKAIRRTTQFRSTNVPIIGENQIGGLSIESGGSTLTYASSMDGGWNVPKRPSWQPELPKQASFFGP